MIRIEFEEHAEVTWRDKREPYARESVQDGIVVRVDNEADEVTMLLDTGYELSIEGLIVSSERSVASDSNKALYDRLYSVLSEIRGEISLATMSYKPLPDIDPQLAKLMEAVIPSTDANAPQGIGYD